MDITGEFCNAVSRSWCKAVLQGTCRWTAWRLLVPTQLFNHRPELLPWKYNGTKLSRSSSIPQMGLAHRCGTLKCHLARQKKKVFFTDLCITQWKVKGIFYSRAGIWSLYSMKTVSWNCALNGFLEMCSPINKTGNSTRTIRKWASDGVKK